MVEGLQFLVPMISTNNGFFWFLLFYKLMSQHSFWSILPNTSVRFAESTKMSTLRPPPQASLSPPLLVCLSVCSLLLRDKTSRQLLQKLGGVQRVGWAVYTEQVYLFSVFVTDSYVFCLHPRCLQPWNPQRREALIQTADTVELLNLSPVDQCVCECAWCFSLV